MPEQNYTPVQKNYALCRDELDSFDPQTLTLNGCARCATLSFVTIKGLSRFWDEDDAGATTRFVADILNSCVRHNMIFAYLIQGGPNGIEISIGTMNALIASVKTSYEAVFAGIDIVPQPNLALPQDACQFGGFFTGVPTDKKNAEKKSLQIENICDGMQGRNFVYLVLATGVSNIAVSYGVVHLLEEMNKTYGAISKHVTVGGQGNVSVEQKDFHSQHYFDHLEALQKILRKGAARGMWRVNGYYASDTRANAQCLANIIKSSFSGEDSAPEPIRVLEHKNIQEVVSNLYRMQDVSPYAAVHPLGHWEHRDVRNNVVPVSLFQGRFETMLPSDQVAVLCDLPTKEYPGYYLDQAVLFDTASRVQGKIEVPVTIAEIQTIDKKGERNLSNPYLVEKDDFTRHALIIGATGGGKTNTAKSMLDTLWNKEQVPFLVIESAKREYWELRNLKGFENLLVFTLGAEAKKTSVPYRINPFEAIPAISLQTHIDYLMATFKAAFELYAPMPYVLETAVYEVYQDRGWDIVENINIYGRTEYPTLSDLYDKIDVVVERLGYGTEVRSNVQAALQARIYSLMIGGKGAMMNTPKSLPIQELLARPVVLELEDLGDDETKSFVIGLLLVQLYEHRKAQMSKGSKHLSHLLLVEEAHRLLKNVPESGEGGNTRAKSVEFFCNLLAEIRTYGQGIFIADQIPTKLAADTIKNTNLKIVHRTVAKEDRETIGNAMNMTPAQIEYLSTLQRGCAAVYAENDYRPKCVRFPLVTSQYDFDRAAVIAQVREQVSDIAKQYDTVVRHHVGCNYCESRCTCLDKVKPYVDAQITVPKLLTYWKNNRYSIAALLETASVLHKERGYHLDTMDACICFYGYILSKASDLTQGQAREILLTIMEEKSKIE